MNIRYPIYEGVYRILTQQREPEEVREDGTKHAVALPLQPVEPD